MIYINGVIKKCLAIAVGAVCAVAPLCGICGGLLARSPALSAQAYSGFIPQDIADSTMIDGVFPIAEELSQNWSAFIDRTFNFENNVIENTLNGSVPIGSAVKDLFTNWQKFSLPIGQEYLQNYNQSGNRGDAGVVDYATYSNGNIQSITVPESYDITGKVCYRYNDDTFDLIQVHLYLNGYRCMKNNDTVATAHYDDCLCQLTLLQDNGSNYTRTFYIKPRQYNCFYDSSDNAVFFDHYFCYDFDNFYEWHWGRLRFHIRSTNDYTRQRSASSKIRDMIGSSNLQNTVFPELFLTSFTSSDPNGAQYVSQLKQYSGASAAAIPCQTFGIVGGTSVSANSPSNGFYSYNGGLALDVTTLTNLTRQLENTIYANFRTLYTHIPQVYEPWGDTTNIVDYYDVYNYYPPTTNTSGLPADWFGQYPAVTTAFSIEPSGGSLPVVTLPAVPSAFPFSDIFVDTGVLPVALSLGVLSLAVGLVF